MSYAEDIDPFLNQFKQLIDAPEEKTYIKKRGEFVYRFSKFMHEKKMVVKIYNQLHYSNLVKDFSKMNVFYGFINYSIYGAFCFLSLIKPKKYTYKFLCFTAVNSAQMSVIEPIFLKLSFRNFGLTRNDYISQEIRLLYLFYFPLDSHAAEMQRKCEQYIEFMKNKKIRIEKYGEA